VSTYEIAINGKEFVVEVGDVSASPVKVVVNGTPMTVEFRQTTSPEVTPRVVERIAEPVVEVPPVSEPVATPLVGGEGQIIEAPMPGKVLSITVAVGDAVSEGDTICTLEAMKMEMPVSSTVSGTVRGIHVGVGDNVAHGEPLVTLG